MYKSLSIASAAALLPLFFAPTMSLGINCRGSALCDRASFNNPSSETIMQILHDAIWTNSKDNSTTYASGDHIICISQSESVSITAGASVDGEAVGASGSFTLNGNIQEGGICVFPQNLANGATLDLGTIRPLTNALLEHKCSVCGSVPIHEVDQGSNDPSDGILTFNYVADPFCDGNCMSASGGSKVKARSAKFRA